MTPMSRKKNDFPNEFCIRSKRVEGIIKQNIPAAFWIDDVDRAPPEWMIDRNYDIKHVPVSSRGRFLRLQNDCPIAMGISTLNMNFIK